MKPIQLPILFYRDGQDAELLGTTDHVEIRLVWFLNISFFEPYKYKDKDYSMIHSNGHSVICTMSNKQIIRIIQENQ